MGLDRQCLDPNPNDGPTRIAFDSTRDGNLEIYSMNADGSILRGSRQFGAGLQPSWSPDARRLPSQVREP